MSRAAAGVALLILASPAAPAQGGVTVTVGPQFALASYREVAAGLRYQGTGFGGALSARYRRLSAEAGVVRVTLDPATGSAATSGFTATEVDAWVAYDLAPYASVEAGLIRRTADPEFDAQSVGAVRIGARSFYEIGPGATVLFRANYLARAVPGELSRSPEVFRRRPCGVLDRPGARPRRPSGGAPARHGGLHVPADQPEDEPWWDRGDRRADAGDRGAAGSGRGVLGDLPVSP